MILDMDYILPEEIKCKNCGYTLSKYKTTGLFGCGNCYDTFKNEIDNILLKIQGKNRHVGKLNKSKTDFNVKEENKVSDLKEKLQKLIKEEKFEEAAIIRDEIKKLEKGGKD